MAHIETMVCRSSIDSLIKELLESEQAERFAQEILKEMTVPSMPDFKKIREGYDVSTFKHGIKFNREEETVKVIYCVAEGIYEPSVLSYMHLTLLLEGTLCWKRKQKW